MTKRACDVSNWSGELTPEILQEWNAAGIKRVIVRASTEHEGIVDTALQQMRAVVAAGLDLQVYLWLYFDATYPAAQQVADALHFYTGQPIDMWWLDCEDTVGHGVSVIPWLVEAENAMEDRPVGIYTSQGFWTEQTDNSTAFSHLPLWDASWGTPDLSRFVEYGGWTKPTMLQYAGDTELAGVKVDMNIYEVE